MSHASASDGTRIFYDITGDGPPLMFLHEFAGDNRSWRDQVRHFSRNFRCITMAARGYPPSDVPTTDDSYSQDIASRDVVAVLDDTGIDQAHIVGLSMGAYTALQLALYFPERCISIVPASGGAGAFKPTRDTFIADSLAAAAAMEKLDTFPASPLALGPCRIQLKNKDRVGWQEFHDHLAEHPVAGSSKVLRNVQAKRPSLYDLEAELRAVTTPTFLMAGDEDEPCLDVNLFLKRTMPAAQLTLLPGCGHLLNLEEPALFNFLVERFIASVERGTWKPRDPRAAVSDKSTFADMTDGETST